jgi:hypothetical protein
MLFRDRSRQIYRRQQNENVGLQQGHANVQSQKRDRHADRDQGKENQRNHVTGKHVGVKTDGQRQDPGEMAYQFYRNHQRRERRHRAGKVLQVADSRMFEPLRLIIEKGAERASERNHRNSGRGFEAGNDADEIAQQNKQTKGHQEGSESFAAVPDNFLALGLDESVRAFEDVLQCPRLVDGKPRPHHKKDHDQKQEDQNFHRHRIRDRRVRIFWLNVERSQQPGNRAGEDVIQECGKPELFVHGTAFSY